MDSFSTINTSSCEFKLQEEFVTLSTNPTLEIKSSDITVKKCYYNFQNHTCKLKFSTLRKIKKKMHENLTDMEEEMKVVFSHIRPDIEKVINIK